MSPDMKVAVDFLYSTPKFTKKNSLDHTRQLMRLLGSPCRGKKIIHIAGSNGKGSVSCFLYHMLLAGGKSAALFTSPHLVDIRERFQMNGEMVSEQVFLDVFDQVRTASEKLVQKTGSHPTFFEFLFAMGMVIFGQADVEYVVLETGLGGRLDATNSFQAPLLSVITSISLEHTEYLGDTLAKIAGEKAGILKPGVPVVFSANEPEAEVVIRGRAASLDCPCVGIYSCERQDSFFKNEECFVENRKNTMHSEDVIGFERMERQRKNDVQKDLLTVGNVHSKSGLDKQNDGLVSGGKSSGLRELESDKKRWKMFQICEIKENYIDFSLWNDYDGKTQWRIPFSAPYQAENAAVAITAMQTLHLLDDEVMQEGLMNARWPGRMQQVGSGIYLDGAHNPSGIAVFLDSVRALTKDDVLPPMLLFSMVRDKDIRTSVHLLSDFHWDCIAVTAIPDDRGTPGAKLKRIFEMENVQAVEEYGDYREAWQKMSRRKRDGQKLFCTGSLYFIGALLELIDS